MMINEYGAIDGLRIISCPHKNLFWYLGSKFFSLSFSLYHFSFYDHMSVCYISEKPPTRNNHWHFFHSNFIVFLSIKPPTVSVNKLQKKRWPPLTENMTSEQTIIPQDIKINPKENNLKSRVLYCNA
jgi:hypothetical protein